MLETDMLNSYAASVQYEKPSTANLQAAQELFLTLLENHFVKPGDIKEWSRLGFSIRKIKEANHEFVVVSEACKDSRHGHGFYVIKTTCKGSQNVLEALHTPSDLYTHELVFRLFMEGNYVAAAWNTAHRNQVDLGKEPISYYNAFTIAVAKAFSRARIIQLHGFDAVSHHINGDMILSSTKRESAPQFDLVVNLLRSDLSGSVSYKILHFPKDIGELGGTLNVNAKAFYDNNPHGLFFHVEMSMPLRMGLRNSRDLRNSFSACFISS
ncbi:hypothetical protein O6H91_08G063000 [Diphasiastrum complanatum]|uniref:Uncharacterized protein n=2 Tax=Diphasiastrum complanatum TaxID=34168 RepID=A0ACC2CYB8_DIPCM|nr:hypothetical protein O6H91_08G062800 [Diphasiastrum complanatum]KAJ7546976.1 hypothetical protein O6H91_08G063000 [Diphasiastrum complanatum]